MHNMSDPNLSITPPVRFDFRMPPYIYNHLGKLASRNKRSINGQLLIILEEYLRNLRIIH